MALFPALLLALVVVVQGCSVPMGWKVIPLQDRAQQARYALYGTVVSDQTPPPVNGTFIQMYTVTVKPMCWLKQGPGAEHQMEGGVTSDHEGGTEGVDTNNLADEAFKNITVVQENLCVSNDLVKGQEYILFLNRRETDDYVVSNINVQTGAIREPTDADFEAVHRGIDAGMKGDPKGVCLEGVEIPCFEGVVDKSVCDKGVVLGGAMWPLILAASLAVFGY